MSICYGATSDVGESSKCNKVVGVNWLTAPYDLKWGLGWKNLLKYLHIFL